jgi:hypothetical protein
MVAFAWISKTNILAFTVTPNNKISETTAESYFAPTLHDTYFRTSQARDDSTKLLHRWWNHLQLSKCLRSVWTRRSSTKPWDKSEFRVIKAKTILTLEIDTPLRNSRYYVLNSASSLTKTLQTQSGQLSMANKKPRSSRLRFLPTAMTCSASRA